MKKFDAKGWLEVKANENKGKFNFIMFGRENTIDIVLDKSKTYKLDCLCHAYFDIIDNQFNLVKFEF